MYSYYNKMKEGQDIINQVIEDPEKYVAFFDIDDTLLDRYGNIIRPIYDLYQSTIQKGIQTVIITARPGFPENSKRTIEELQNKGFIPYTLLYLRPPNNNDQNFKLFCRRDALQITGLIPLFSIGDQPWDVGVYGGVPLLLG